jgi:hypothetical protein
MAKKPKNGELSEARIELARAEYVNRYLLTCSFVEAEDAYRRSIGDLSVEIPRDLEADAIDRRLRMLKILEPEILQIKRQEFKEVELLHAQLRKLVLVDEVAETGIPDDIRLDQLKGIAAEDIMSVMNGFQRLQEMRREVLDS